MQKGPGEIKPAGGKGDKKEENNQVEEITLESTENDE